MKKIRTPRKKKKSILKGGMLLYDLACLPKGLLFKDIIKIFHEQKIVVYNSCAAGNISGKECKNIPYVINNKVNVKFKDLSQIHDK